MQTPTRRLCAVIRDPYFWIAVVGKILSLIQLILSVKIGYWVVDFFDSYKHIVGNIVRGFFMVALLYLWFYQITNLIFGWIFQEYNTGIYDMWTYPYMSIFDMYILDFKICCFLFITLFIIIVRYTGLSKLTLSLASWFSLGIVLSWTLGKILIWSRTKSRHFLAVILRWALWITTAFLVLFIWLLFTWIYVVYVLESNGIDNFRGKHSVRLTGIAKEGFSGIIRALKYTFWDAWFHDVPLKYQHSDRDGTPFERFKRGKAPT
jgi:hypothetical protein